MLDNILLTNINSTGVNNESTSKKEISGNADEWDCANNLAMLFFILNVSIEKVNELIYSAYPYMDKEDLNWIVSSAKKIIDGFNEERLMR